MPLRCEDAAQCLVQAGGPRHQPAATPRAWNRMECDCESRLILRAGLNRTRRLQGKSRHAVLLILALIRDQQTGRGSACIRKNRSTGQGDGFRLLSSWRRDRAIAKSWWPPPRNLANLVQTSSCLRRGRSPRDRVDAMPAARLDGGRPSAPHHHACRQAPETRCAILSSARCRARHRRI